MEIKKGMINMIDINRIRNYKELDELVINLTKDIEGKIYLLIDKEYIVTYSKSR